MNKSDVVKKCTVCQNETEFLGQIPFRTKGSGGATQLLFGQWAELGEQKYPLDVYRCKKCGHLEFYDLDASLSTKNSDRDSDDV